MEEMGKLLNKRVLITGAGGSIGSELAKQIWFRGNRDLILLDRDETLLHALELKLCGTGLLTLPGLVLADIRDLNALETIFIEHVPEVVVHCAALKHVPLLERFPVEAWKTNVLGTFNVLLASQKVGTSTFVNISTDKAVHPTTVLGKSKYLTEQLILCASEGRVPRYVHDEETFIFDTDGIDTGVDAFSEGGEAHASSSQHRYVNVRFGNVRGSRGSVKDTFSFQIQSGLPVSVTSADAARYMMSVEQACSLILSAIDSAQNGETLVLDMGDEVKIVDFAKELMANEGREVPINFVGLRGAEKTREQLFNVSDHKLRVSEGVSYVRVARAGFRSFGVDFLKEE